MDEELSSGVACRWCRLLGSQGRTVYDEPAFVVVETPARRRRRSLTLVPRAHVNVVTELPLPEMAAVLAGLSRASDFLRHSSGGAGVRINAHPRSGRPADGHVHFQLGTTLAGTAQLGFESGPAEGPSAFASLADAISH
jgi:diadenosine tetraphosphate (Ap4A) HIT family hydrolase